MPSKQEMLQEIANRGLQDKLPPEKKAIFDEAVNRGLIQIGEPTQVSGITGPITKTPEQQQFEETVIGDPRQAVIGAGRGFVDVGEGVSQLGLDIAGKFSPEAQRRADEFTRRAEEERQLFAQTPVGQSALGKASRVLGNIAPAVAIPGGAIGFGGRALAQGAAIGAGFGATQFQPGEDRGTERLKSTALGGTLGAAVPGAIQLGKRIASPLASMARKNIVDGAFQKADDLLKKLNIKATVGARSGDPRLLQLETGSARGVSNKAMDFLNEKSKSTISMMNRLTETFTKKTTDPTVVGARVFRATRNAINRMDEARQARAHIDFGLVDDLGKGKIIKVDNFKKFMEKEAGVQVAGSEAATMRGGAALKKLLSQVDDKGRLQADEMLEYLSNWSELSAGKGRLFTDILDKREKIRIGSEGIRALMQDLNSASKGGSEVAKAIKIARDNYREATIPIRKVQKTFLGKLVDKDEADADTIAKALVGMQRQRAKDTMRMIDNFDPNVANQVRGMHIDQALKAATKVDTSGSIRLIKFDDQKAFDMLSKNNLVDTLFDKRGAARVKEAMEAIKIMGSHSQGAAGARTIQTSLEQGIATTASFDPTFLALNLARNLLPWQFRKALLTEKGQNALITAARHLKDPTKLRNPAIAATNELRKVIEE